MKIIKTFEGFNGELYKAITSFEFVNTISGLNFVDFNRINHSQLSNLFKGTEWEVGLGKHSNKVKSLSTYVGAKNDWEDGDSFTTTGFRIYELPDEYFVMSLEEHHYVKYQHDEGYYDEGYYEVSGDEWDGGKSKYWRCDGIDGLKECIEDNILSL